MLLFAYSAGLSIPFLAMGLAYNSVQPFYNRIKRYTGVMYYLSGALLIIIGILVFTNTRLAPEQQLRLRAAGVQPLACRSRTFRVAHCDRVRSALAGVAVIVGVAMLGIWAAGVFDTASGEAAALVDNAQRRWRLDLEVGPLAGQVAPDFEMSDFDGNRHRLSDYRGKVVYLNFWATWCVPCQAELPEIYRLHQEYGDRLVVIEINRGGVDRQGADFFENLGNLDGGKGVSFTVDGIDPTAALYDRYHTLPLQVTADQRLHRRARRGLEAVQRPAGLRRMHSEARRSRSDESRACRARSRAAVGPRFARAYSLELYVTGAYTWP